MTVQPTDDPFAVEDVRPFVPALDFAMSKAFYEAIGWTTVWTDDDGLALMELGGHRFMLQNFYVKDWGATVTYVWDPSGVLLHFTQWM